MKLKDVFLTYEEDGEQIMVASDTKKFSGLVRSNKTAAEIVEALKTETTKEQIVKLFLEKYDVSEERVSADVERILEALRSIGALDE